MRIWYLMCGLTQEYAVAFANNEEEAFEIAEQQFREDCNNSSTYIDCDEVRLNEIEKIEEGE